MLLDVNNDVKLMTLFHGLFPFVGVSAQSFIQCFTMTHTAFNVQLATPGVSILKI